MTKRIFLIFLISSLFVLPSFALTSSSYSDLSPTASQVTSLLSYAWGIDNFNSSEWVCYRSDQNDYYLVWSDDLSFSGQHISGSDVSYIRYYRPNNTSSWSYVFGSDSSFSLNIVYAVVSSISEAGFSSPLYFELLFYDYFNYFIIFVVSMLFVCMVKSLRR